MAVRTGSNIRIKELKEEINVLMDQETRMWNQLSHILWLKNGDGNTKFFHTRASHRFRKNVILGINDPHGDWKVEPNDIGEVLINFYQELFTTSNPTLHEDVLDQIPRVILDDMNKDLMCKFKEWEVVQALKHMAHVKAPNPNGMPPLFFQHFWHMIERDVIHLMLSWLNSSTLPHPVNHTIHTFITLIPKMKNPSFMSEYCLISLCNVLYKIFSKVLANRLKKLLNSVITEH